MYYEDIDVGLKYALEPVVMTEEDILSFARRFDPLPIHVDPAFAEKSVHGGIIASGFHTLCAVYGQWAKHHPIGKTVIGGLGFETLKWTAPVRINDVLTGEMEVIEKIPSSKGGRGIIGFRLSAWNQNQQLVLTVEIRAMIKARS